jgi:hypothetical protein
MLQFFSVCFFHANDVMFVGCRFYDACVAQAVSAVTPSCV